LSERPGTHGKIEDMTFAIYDKEHQKKYLDFSKKEPALQQALEELQTQRGHTLIAIGGCGESGGQPFYADFLLTLREGETFLSIINHSENKFEPWRIHYIRGKERVLDLLIFEMGTKTTGRQVMAFRRSGNGQAE
jgi:hypothetical protein